MRLKHSNKGHGAFSRTNAVEVVPRLTPPRRSYAHAVSIRLGAVYSIEGDWRSVALGGVLCGRNLRRYAT